MPRQNSKSGKSSKTARVLNLLTDPNSVIENSTAEPAEEKDAERAAGDKKAQESIRGALETEFGNLAPARAKRPAAPTMPIQSAPKSGAAKGGGEEDEDIAPTWEIVPARSDTHEDDASDIGHIYPTLSSPKAPATTAEEKLRSAGDKAPDEYICFNVTQALVEDRVDKYMRMFGMCTCARCRIDVIALAMSNLPAKYVVAKPHELIPRLSMYEHKYEAAIVTQVMSACRKVLERPHHTRKTAD